MITLTDVWKQEKGQTILKSLHLSIKQGHSVGIRMTHEESYLLLQLLMGKKLPTSGTIQKDEIVLMTSLPDDGMYEYMTVKNYLAFFKEIVGSKLELEAYRTIFSLMDSWNLPLKDLTFDQKKRVVFMRFLILSPDIVFLEHPFINLTNEGIELSIKSIEFLKEQGITFIFTSNYMEDLLLVTDEVYHYHAQYGLQRIELDREEEEAAASIEEKELLPLKSIVKISCKLADKTIFFRPDEIEFIESLNSISHVRIGEESFPTTLTMNELEARLQSFGFFRCHRSYLVNLQRISELISYSKNSYTLLLKGNQAAKIPLSRSRLEELRHLIDG